MESVDIETKKKQHYVPQFYLKNWLSHEGIWVKNSIGEKSKIYLKKNTTDIAEENYFYKIKMDDIVWDLLIARYHEELKNDTFLQSIFKELQILTYADNVINKGWLVVNDDKELKESASKTLEIMNKIFFENKHSDIENFLSPMVKETIEKMESNLVIPVNEEMYTSIIFFYSVQYFRTKKAFLRMNEIIDNLCLIRGDQKFLLSDEQKETYFKCILYIMSIQFALEIEKKCTGIKVYRNHTKINYLTSDSPSIYIKDKLIAAIPLSPKLFFHFDLNEKPTLNLLSKKVTIEKIDIYSTEKIKVFNEMINFNSKFFLFAKKKKDFHYE